MKTSYTGSDVLTIDKYKKLIKGILSNSRYEHCINVSNEAVKLAEKYGADPQKAQVAGILHDVTKEISPEEHLDIFNKFGVDLNEIERSSQKLWHAISGAEYIKNELGITDKDILNSVRYHTTARENMSLLEKIIFIADFISEDRDYEGVEAIRNVAYKSLEEAMLEGLLFSIKSLVDKKMPIYEGTFKAYNKVTLKGSDIS